MKYLAFLLVLATLVVLLVQGAVLTLGLVVISVNGTLALTKVVCVVLYVLGVAAVIGLLWLLCKLGGKL